MRNGGWAKKGITFIFQNNINKPLVVRCFFFLFKHFSTFCSNEALAEPPRVYMEENGEIRKHIYYVFVISSRDVERRIELSFYMQMKHYYWKISVPFLLSLQANKLKKWKILKIRAKLAPKHTHETHPRKWFIAHHLSSRFNFEDETPTTNFDTFPAAILTVFQVLTTWWYVSEGSRLIFVFS